MTEDVISDRYEPQRKIPLSTQLDQAIRNFNAERALRSAYNSTGNFLRREAAAARYYGGRAVRRFEDRYAYDHPQQYLRYLQFRTGIAARWRGKEGLLATPAASGLAVATTVNAQVHSGIATRWRGKEGLLAGLAVATTVNAQVHSGIAPTLHGLASAARLTAIAALKFAAVANMATFATLLSTIIIPATLIAVVGFSLHMAHKAYKNPQMGFWNRGSAFGAAAVAVTSVIPGLDLIPYVSKAFSGFMLLRNGYTSLKGKGQFWKEASDWQKVLMLGGVAASLLTLSPLLAGWSGLSRSVTFGAGNPAVAPTGQPALAPSGNHVVMPADHSVPPAAPYAGTHGGANSVATGEASPMHLTGRNSGDPSLMRMSGARHHWAGWTLTSPFGGRFHEHRLGWHPGIDLSRHGNTDIYGVMPGKVIFAGAAGGYGNMVAVETHLPDGRDIIQKFGHMRHIYAHVGDHVDGNCILGKEGNTGFTDGGAHTHYETDLFRHSFHGRRHIPCGTPFNPWTIDAVREAFRNVTLPRGYRPYRTYAPNLAMS